MMSNKRFGKLLLIAIATALLIIAQTGCGRNTETLREPLRKEGFYLDTFCSITIYAVGEGADASEVMDGAFLLCQDYEKMLSKTIEGSDVWKINHSEGEGVECNPETIQVIEKGIRYGDLSSGAFDIAIGRITELWDFHAVEPQVPDSEQLELALSHVNWQLVNVDGNKVTLGDPEMKLDLGGIAKGYIADKMSDYLISSGVTGAVVDLGGNISVIGHKDGSTGNQEVKVGIRKPFSQSGELASTIPLHDASVVTSGTYERFIEVNGKTYHHILDPRTGYSAESELTSISVVGPLYTSCDCDALATTILLMGTEWAETLASSEEFSEFSFLLIFQDGTQRWLGKNNYS